MTAAEETAAVQASGSPAGQQPARKKRATKTEMDARKAEIEAKKVEKEKKEAERAAKAAEKAAEKAKADAEKQAKAEERERRKREREEEEAKKAEEKAKKAEEEAKKKRAQPTLTNFFKMKPTATKEGKNDGARQASPAGTPQKAEAKEVSLYEQMFKPFFVKEQVTLAPRFQMDEETKDLKTRIFDEYVSGKRGADIKVTPFNPEKALDLPFIVPRGRLYPSVRQIMTEWNDNSARKPVDLTTESQNTQIRNTRRALQEVPMKFLGFKEDVRPPYYGTVTAMPSSLASLRRLARNPVAEDVLPLQYDYDSEAEWQEEDGEDVDLLDDEEDDADNDEEMDDFLDDSEDVGLTRPALVSGLEPESTDICWENRNRLGPKAHMYKYRMEFILGTSRLSSHLFATLLRHHIETLDHHHSIDPFSPQYWETVKPAVTTSTIHLTPSSAATSSKPDSKTMRPPGATDAFKALGATATTVPGRPKTISLAPDMIEKLKELVMEKKSLSKVGIVELFNSENKVPKAAIKSAIDMIAEKKGKEWVLKAGA